MTKTVVALIYDFDKTLATDDMQAFSFIPNLGMTSAKFWKETGDFAKKTGTESTLAYLHTMIKECKEKLLPLIEEYEEKYGPLRKEANTANKWQWVKNPWPWDNEEDL